MHFIAGYVQINVNTKKPNAKKIFKVVTKD